MKNAMVSATFHNDVDLMRKFITSIYNGYNLIHTTFMSRTAFHMQITIRTCLYLACEHESYDILDYFLDIEREGVYDDLSALIVGWYVDAKFGSCDPVFISSVLRTLDHVLRYKARFMDSSHDIKIATTSKFNRQPIVGFVNSIIYHLNKYEYTDTKIRRTFDEPRIVRDSLARVLAISKPCVIFYRSLCITCRKIYAR